MADLLSLIARTRDGDLEAYAEIVRRFQDMAYGYGYSLLGDFQLAEDAAQEAFIQAYRDLADLREPDAFAGWFRRIVFHQCTRITRRKRLNTVPFEAAAEVPYDAPGPAEIAEKRDLREQVTEAIRALPENERVVTTLFYINGYSHNDIAGFLEVPVSTVKSPLHTSRRRLKERMISMVSESLRESALPESFTSRVLSNIPPLGWGKQKECTFVGALESALSVTDRPYDYATIMGATGLAFRVRWYQPAEGRGWCPSSPVGEFPEEIEAASNAVGWRFRLEEFDDIVSSARGKPNMDCFAPEMVCSIDAGKPVLAYDDSFNMCVISGYDDGGRTVLMKNYFQGEQVVRKPTADLAGFLLFLHEQTEPLSPEDVLRQALQMGVRNWRRNDRPSYGHPGHYLYGSEALAKWSDDLALTDLKEDERGWLFFVSWWNFSSLADARVAAVRFLRESGALLSGQAEQSLAAAAEAYEREVSLLGSAFGSKDAFLGPWSGKTIADWTPEVRQHEREILMRAAEIETAAIGEMEKALASAG